MDNTTEEKLTTTPNQPNMDNITEDTLITTFDRLVEDGVIVYGPHTTNLTEDFGYPVSNTSCPMTNRPMLRLSLTTHQFEFRICPHLATKPHTVGASNPRFNASRPYGPGSDLFCPDERLNVAKLNGTHQLALNLFCVDRPQLLMLTLNSYKRQHEALDMDDIKVMLDVLRRFPSFYLLFNCGEKGGCSRVHKHMQGLRGPPHAFKHVQSPQTPPGTIPFEYFIYWFQDGFDTYTDKEVFDVYVKYLDRCRSALGVDKNDTPPHNVVIWADHMIVIPRRKGSHDGASANAGGMMGSVWVSNMDHVREWWRVGCSKVLRELGVANPASNMKV
jgi:ATP adenylyltransferase/5',5'''-P-1,P-4-tetraphosphate phosphorylase II